VERPGSAHKVVQDLTVDSGRLVILVAARGLGARHLGEVDAGQLVERRVDVSASAALVVRADQENPGGGALEGHDDPVMGAQVLHAQSGERLFAGQPVGKARQPSLTSIVTKASKALRRGPRSPAICRWAMGVALTS